MAAAASTLFFGTSATTAAGGVMTLSTALYTLLPVAGLIASVLVGVIIPVIGTFITSKVVDGLIGVSVITKSANNKMLKEMRDKGFGVSVVDLKKTNDNNKKDMLIIELNKKKLKELTHIIRTNDPDAFVVINETKYVQNGLIK